MKTADLETLAGLSRTIQDADAARMQRLRTEEAKIRAQLVALDTRFRSGRSMQIIESLPQRRLGADVLWQAWVSRNRQELQMQLARCLALQGAARRALRKSFGKRVALEGVAAGLAAKTRHAVIAKSFDDIAQLGVFKHLS